MLNMIDLSEGDINISKERERWQNENLCDTTKKLLKEDEKYFLHQSLSSPCLNVIKASVGTYLKDMQDNLIMDFHGNNLHQLGFNNEKIIKAIKETMDILPFSTRRYTNEYAIDLAKKMSELSPGNLNKVLFAPGATSAIGMAIKLARLVSKKFNTISMWDSFHGASLDAISIGGESFFRNGMGPLLSGAEHTIPYNSYRTVFTCEKDYDLRLLEILEYTLEKQGETAAVILETIRNTDVQIPTKRYMQGIRKLCDKYNALLILDETAIAFGRTGKMFAFEHFEIIPDMFIVGKGFGGGVFPFAGLISRDTYNIGKDKALGHYTHEKSPIGSVAALKTIEYIEEENLLEEVNEKSEYVKTKLDYLEKNYELVGDIRIIGLLFAIELVKDRINKDRAVEEAEKVMYISLEKGLSFKVSKGNVLTLSPPLTISYQEIDKAFDILEEALKEVS